MTRQLLHFPLTPMTNVTKSGDFNLCSISLFQIIPMDLWVVACSFDSMNWLSTFDSVGVKY